MPALIPLDTTYGVMLIGAVFGIWLFGASVVQLYIYFSRFPDDALYIKVFVSVIMALDVAQAAFMVHLMYTLLVTNWGDVSSLNNVPWSLHPEIISNAVVVFMVQCFFIRRIWVLSGHKHWVAVILSAIAFTILGCAMFIGVKDAGHQKFLKFHDYTPIIITWSVCDMVVDGAIASLLCYYLHKSRRGIKSSDSIINTLMIFSINTGAITGSASAAHLVTFLASPATGVHFAFHFVLPKLYTNAVYASLNTRAVFQGKGERDRAVSSTYTGRSTVDSRANYHNSAPRTTFVQRPIEITCITETYGALSPPPAVRHSEKLRWSKLRAGLTDWHSS